MLLGCIADDLTGATDLALTLTRAGMRTVQVMEVPGPSMQLAGFDAVVVALKTRTCPPGEAIDLSLRSADALLALGARQLFFKYCSTFDSTDDGNIGPVAEALLAHVDPHGIALACPAFPTNKRTVYQGHLFVGDVLLSDSPMKDHPLTPMRDANLVRVLQRQTRLPVGLVPFAAVERGADAISADFAALRAAGKRLAIVDAISDRHLSEIGRAARDHKLVTGGSGVAMGLPANFIAAGAMRETAPAARMTAAKGRSVILAGSCSEATRGQVAAAIAAGMPAFRIVPSRIEAGSAGGARALQWAAAQPSGKPILIYSSAEPAEVQEAQAKLGRAVAGALVESELAAIAAGLVAAGCTRLIVAGGETSGAVVNGLGITALEIGPEIDPGVPWCRAVGERPLVVALKSGNFGARDFFLKAWDRLA